MTPNSGEYKSTVGVDQMHVALVTQDDVSGYVADVPEIFAPTSEVSGEPTTSLDTQYADNQPYEVLASEGETKLTISVTAIPIETLAKYLGKVFDATSGRMFDAGGAATPPDVALSFRSLKSNGSQRYYQYLKGRFSVPKDEAATKGEKAEPKPQQVIFTAINTTHPFVLSGTVTSGVKRVVGDEDTLNFSGTTFFNAVQTPSISAPSALALSSSVPVDDATGVSKTANQTLTFNNALMDSAVNHITLLDDVNAPVAAAITLDATKKIVTIDPTSALGGSKEHKIVAAVTDIYGQSGSFVVTFTTAA